MKGRNFRTFGTPLESLAAFCCSFRPPITETMPAVDSAPWLDLPAVVAFDVRQLESALAEGLRSSLVSLSSSSATLNIYGLNNIKSYSSLFAKIKNEIALTFFGITDCIMWSLNWVSISRSFLASSDWPTFKKVFRWRTWVKMNRWVPRRWMQAWRASLIPIPIWNSWARELLISNSNSKEYILAIIMHTYKGSGITV